MNVSFIIRGKEAVETKIIFVHITAYKISHFTSGICGDSLKG